MQPGQTVPSMQAAQLFRVLGIYNYGTPGSTFYIRKNGQIDYLVLLKVRFYVSRHVMKCKSHLVRLPCLRYISHK